MDDSAAAGVRARPDVVNRLNASDKTSRDRQGAVDAPPLPDGRGSFLSEARSGVSFSFQIRNAQVQLNEDQEWV